MRWHFSEFESPQEAIERKLILANIDQWWSAFSAKTDDLKLLFSKQSNWDLPGWMEEHLQSLSPNLMWEFGPAVNAKGHRLVITPEHNYQLLPFTQAILERAPKIDGWEFYRYRLPESFELANISTEQRLGVNIAEYKVKLTQAENHKIDLLFTAPAIIDENNQDQMHAAFIAIECLLGEECLNEWVGAIDISSYKNASGNKSWFSRSRLPESFINLADLPKAFQLHQQKIISALPDTPIYAWLNDQTSWSLWNLKPGADPDYTAQHDLFVARSAYPAFWVTAHQGGYFSSQRYSKHGETFCYLKMDGSDELEDCAYQGKDEIEDAIDQLLIPLNLGCHLGGGTGQRYSYIDLALTDAIPAIKKIRDLLQTAKLTRRSWIQFYDTSYSQEWVGIYDDSPTPPGFNN